MTTETLTDRIIKVYVDSDVTALDGLYAPDAVVDCNVPQWRYQLKGAEEINGAIRDEELGVSGRRVPVWRSVVTEEGLFLETEVRFNDHGEERMWRSVHLFRTADGQIAGHTLYCSGIWIAGDITRHDAANAPVHA